jgi:hypothetical protein
LVFANKAIQAKGIMMDGFKAHVTKEDEDEIAYYALGAHWTPRRKVIRLAN